MLKNRGAAIALVALIAVPLVGGWFASQHPHRPIYQTETAKRPAKSGKQSVQPASVEGPDGGAEPAKKNSSADTQHSNDKAAEWTLVYVTGALVLVGIFQLGVFCWQLWLIGES